MGTKYVLPAISEDVPTHVEGVRVWSTWCDKKDQVKTVCLNLRYWDGAEELAKRLITMAKCTITDNGGTDANWATLISRRPTRPISMT